MGMCMWERGGLVFRCKRTHVWKGQRTMSDVFKCSLF